MPLIGKQTVARPSLVESIKQGLAVPVISDEGLFDLALANSAPTDEQAPGEASAAFVAYFAEQTRYALDDRDNVARMARAYKLARQKASDYTDKDLKVDYLNYVKNFVYNWAQAAGAHAETLAEAEANFDHVPVSGLANQFFGYPRLDQGPADPLLVLASLPFRTLLTTSPYTFVEDALRKMGKEPLTFFCPWRPELRQFAETRIPDTYLPNAPQPLVYHLFGLDRYSNSLVLTEDDYLDFLVSVADGMNDDRRDVLPGLVRQALSNDLLLLGFSLNSWAFRMLYAGLIKPKDTRQAGEKRGVCSLQLIPNVEEKAYLNDYLQREAKFDVVWGSLYQYAAELRKL